MTTWSNRQLYDRIFDRWTEKDNDYAKANRNRDVITTHFRSDEIISTDDTGNLVGQEIYNGSPSWYSRSMANGMQGSLTPKNISWFRYKMDNLKLKGADQVDLWLQRVKEHMAAVYQKSNFYDIQPQFMHDGVTTGSPLIFAEEDEKENRTMWLPQHYKTVRIYYNKFNEPEGVITKDKTWTAKQLMDEFVGDDDEQHTRAKQILSNAAFTAIDSGQLQDVFTVYRATFKVTDPIWDGTGDGAFVKPTGGWTWLTAYFEELTEGDSSKKNDPLNDDMGDFSQPFSVWNYDKKPWEATSRTPSFYALWDNLGLQQIDKNYLEDVQYTNRPAMMALSGMNGRLQLGPEGQILVTDKEYDRPPKPIDRVGGLTFEKDLIDMKDEALSRWFMMRMWEMFTQLARDKNQPVSAQQIWRMAGEKATMLSPAVETHSSYLRTVDARMVDIEARAGRGPFAPDEMADIVDIIAGIIGEDDATTVNIQPVFVGPLAQAQQTSQALEPIQTGLEASRAVIEIWPEARHKFKPGILIEEITEAIDFPQDAMVSEDEFDEIVQAERQAVAQQQQQENAVEMAKASKSLQGPVDENSVLAKAGEAAA